MFPIAHTILVESPVPDLRVKNRLVFQIFLENTPFACCTIPPSYIGPVANYTGERRMLSRKLVVLVSVALMAPAPKLVSFSGGFPLGGAVVVSVDGVEGF